MGLRRRFRHLPQRREADLGDFVALSRDLLRATLAVEGRHRVTIDDLERADALARAMLTLRRHRALRHAGRPARPGRPGATGPSPLS